MTSETVHIRNSDVIPTRDRNAVILVVDRDVGDQNIAARRNTEPVRIMRCREAIRPVVWGVTGGIIEDNVANYEIRGASYAEKMCGPVLDT